MPPAATAVLREVLARASYDAGSVRDLVRADGLDMLPGLAVLRLRPEGDEPLGRLVRLFLGGQAGPEPGWDERDHRADHREQAADDDQVRADRDEVADALAEVGVE